MEPAADPLEVGRLDAADAGEVAVDAEGAREVSRPVASATSRGRR